MKHQNKNPLKNACRLLTYVWKSAPEIFFSKIVIMLLTVVLDVYLNISLIRIVVDAITKGMSFGYIVTYICVLSGILLIELLLESVQNEYINPICPTWHQRLLQMHPTKLFPSASTR